MDDEMTFEENLVNAAKKTRDDYLASGKPCCFNCQFSRPPKNPNHASHYIMCEWIFMIDLPVHLNFGKSTYTALQPFTSGQDCPAWEMK